MHAVSESMLPLRRGPCKRLRPPARLPWVRNIAAPPQQALITFVHHLSERFSIGQMTRARRRWTSSGVRGRQLKPGRGTRACARNDRAHAIPGTATDTKIPCGRIEPHRLEDAMSHRIATLALALCSLLVLRCGLVATCRISEPAHQDHRPVHAGRRHGPHGPNRRRVPVEIAQPERRRGEPSRRRIADRHRPRRACQARRLHAAVDLR